MENTFRHSEKVPQLYKASSRALKEVIEKGTGVKDVIFKQSKFLHTQSLLALIAKTLQHYSEINKLISKAQLFEKEPKLDPWLARILITQLLLTEKGLNGTCKPIVTILSYRTVLENAASDFLTYQKTQTKVCKPRYVCVNTLAISVDEAINGFCGEDWNFVSYDGECYEEFIAKVASLREYEFMTDFHIKELLIFPPKTTFYDHAAYHCKSIRLQDKASCIPVHLLHAPPGSTVLDMCAAPGMKTLFIAGLLNNTGVIYAVEKSANRFNTLNELIAHTGATCIRTMNKDVFDVSAEQCPNVEYILVDPSCSGSGITDRPVLDDQEKINHQRLNQLSSFQISLLKHALTNFPQAKRVVYSTCSIYPEENEYVVREVLKDNSNFKLISANKLLGNSFRPPANLIVDDGIKSIAKKCIHTTPEKDLTNGFFVAVFVRRGHITDFVLDGQSANDEACTEHANSAQQSETMNSSSNEAAEKKTKKKLAKVSVENVVDCAVEQMMDVESKSRKKKRKHNITNTVAQEEDLDKIGKATKRITEDTDEHIHENSKSTKKTNLNEELLSKIRKSVQSLEDTDETNTTMKRTTDEEKQVKKRKVKKSQNSQ